MVSRVRGTTEQLRPILVVEDDEAIRESLRDVLELEGWSVAQADNGSSALDLLEGGLQPSLVLLDLMMPVMNGLELLSRLRSTPLFASLAVIVVSAWPPSAIDLPGSTQGFVKKPVDLDLLLAAIAKTAHA
jgi:CheY-like chemotaxis protein